MSRKPMTYWTSWHMPKVKLENILISEFCQIFIKVKKIVYFVAKKCRSHFNLTIFFAKKFTIPISKFLRFFPWIFLRFFDELLFSGFFWRFSSGLSLNFLMIFPSDFPAFFDNFCFPDFFWIFFRIFFFGWFSPDFPWILTIFSGFSWKMFTFQQSSAHLPSIWHFFFHKQKIENFDFADLNFFKKMKIKLKICLHFRCHTASDQVRNPNDYFSGQEIFEVAQGTCHSVEPLASLCWRCHQSGYDRRWGSHVSSRFGITIAQPGHFSLLDCPLANHCW